MAGALSRRFHANFMLSDRSAEYEALIVSLLRQGYEFLTVREIVNHLRQGAQLPPRRVTLRHDIDTDADYASRWLAIERKLGVKASYYFRLRTLDFPTMERIEKAGGEASYHFEELASVLRRLGKRREARSEDVISLARSEFEKNFSLLSRRCGWSLETVASHGDFVNRRVGVTNSIITADPDLRTRLGIIAEAYDQDLVRTFDQQLSDGMVVGWRRGETPMAAADNDVASMQILTHPRHWRAKVAANLVEDADRVISGALFAAAFPAGPWVDLINRRGVLRRGT